LLHLDRHNEAKNRFLQFCETRLQMNPATEKLTAEPKKQLSSIEQTIDSRAVIC